MARFHINPETQKVGRCRAQIQCEFADSETGQEPIHFSNMKDANAYVEKKLAEEMEETPSTVSKEHDDDMIALSKSGIEYVKKKEAQKKIGKLYNDDMEKYYSSESSFVTEENKREFHNKNCRCAGCIGKFSYTEFSTNEKSSNEDHEELATQYFDPNLNREIVNRSGKPIYVNAVEMRKDDSYRNDEEYKNTGDPRFIYRFSISTKAPKKLSNNDVSVKIESK